jgi:hypothetical protein
MNGITGYSAYPELIRPIVVDLRILLKQAENLLMLLQKEYHLK